VLRTRRFAYNLTKGSALLGPPIARERELDGARARRALPILARGAALRFLLTRLYDWLHPDPTGDRARRRIRANSPERLRIHFDGN
jgi:homoserine kinase type II